MCACTAGPYVGIGVCGLARNGTGSATRVRSVERAITLLFRLAEHRRGVALQQLAREVGCSKSTVHRLLATLESMDVVERDTPLGHYRLGRRAREFAPTGWGRTDLRQLALPYMRQLREESEETVTLHLLDGYEHVVVEECESQEEIRRTLPLGQRAPLLRGATAKAILAFLPDAEAGRILGVTATPDEGGPRRKSATTFAVWATPSVFPSACPAARRSRCRSATRASASVRR